MEREGGDGERGEVMEREGGDGENQNVAHILTVGSGI